ncbi:MAG: iron-sulfur cluster assembly accessory protein [Proteobacteria bacterium]|nr:iron-sulfur cluster assembly accessory protein [Pseudomonadota bacterium]MBU1686073.1 iron-sulfur cluster assembly accessory protein [Pseudomonadota bacterium]
MNITILENALKMLGSKLESDQFLRIGVTEGGCAGLTYSAEISREMKPGEQVVHTVGAIRIVATEEAAGYLEGLVIDYADDLINGGLQFTNANTKKTCGCGKSFSLSGFPVISGGSCTTK